MKEGDEVMYCPKPELELRYRHTSDSTYFGAIGIVTKLSYSPFPILGDPREWTTIRIPPDEAGPLTARSRIISSYRHDFIKVSDLTPFQLLVYKWQP